MWIKIKKSYMFLQNKKIKFLCIFLFIRLILNKIFLLSIFTVFVFAIFFLPQDAHASLNIHVVDQPSCEAAPLSGIWIATNNTCRITDFTLNSGDSLTVGINSAVPIMNFTITGTLANNVGATINNYADVYNEGIFVNNSTYNSQLGSLANIGTITIDDSSGSADLLVNRGDIFNSGNINVVFGSLRTGGSFNGGPPIIYNHQKGVITINGSGFIMTDGGSLDNFGQLTNNGHVQLLGFLTNENGGIIQNNVGANIFIEGADFTEKCGSTLTGTGTVAEYAGTTIVESCPSSSSVQSANGAGSVTFTTSSGGFSSLTTISQSSLSTQPPAGSYPFGFFNWSVIGLSNGGSTTVSITYPSDPGTVYEKLIAGTWYAITPSSKITNPDGSVTITLTLTDGTMGQDADQTANGQITDPGGMGIIAPQQLTQQLVNIINSMNINHGIITSLDAKLNSAISSLASSHNNTAKNQLNAFINEVNAQTGKMITQAQATKLIQSAQNIINSIH